MNTCPNCKTLITESHLIDNEWSDGVYYDCVEATCPCCGKKYRWCEVYTFSRIEGMEEITEEDL